ncbi:MAG TPA: DUF3180 domain-containing protein [Jiangellales bacterium]|nr:DUF3180 domain-containing protein [Jiangellales bacterium]
MRPTRVSLLLALVAAAVVVGWSIGRSVDAITGSLPVTPRITPALLAFLAVVLLVSARVVRGWVLERRYDRRMNALRVTRLLALAQAAAVTGALVAGGYAGVVLLYVQVQPAALGRERVVVAGLTALAGVAVSVSGLVLERACRVPPGEDEDPSSTPDGGGVRPAG